MFDQTNLPIYEVTAELPGGLLRFTFSSLKEAYANYGSLCQKYPNPRRCASRSGAPMANPSRSPVPCSFN